MDKLESGILALETEYGPVYVQPSGWERLYLLWTFRHFNSLALKTLNSRQRRLVERLPRCSTRGSWDKLDRMRVIGTVEGATTPSFPTRLSIEKTAEAEPVEAAFLTAPLTAPVPSDLCEKNGTPDEVSKTPASFTLRRGRSKIALTVATGTLSAVVAVAAWHRLQPTETSNAASVQTSNHVPERGFAESAVQSNSNQAPIETSLVAGVQTDSDPISRTGDVNHTADIVASPPSMAEVSIPKEPIAIPTAISSPSEPKAINTAKIPGTLNKRNLNPDQTEEHPILASIQEGGVQEETPRIQFAGPPRRLIYPVYPQTTVRGKVTLKAVIGPDGRVREVKTLSGNKVLSAAAARAIRQWRYDPFYKNGVPFEADTNISVLFVSADVISISFPSAAPISQ